MINYGYFRHRFDAHTDPKLNELVDDLGVVAYAYYYTLVEIYGSHYASNIDEEYIKIHVRVISNTWRLRSLSCDKVMTKLQLSGLLVYTKTKNTYSLHIPNFLKYYGSYKKRDTSTPPNKRKEKKRKEKEIKVNKSKIYGAVTASEFGVSPEQVIALWNSVSQENNFLLPRAKILNTTRITKIKSCVRECLEMKTMTDWKNYFELIFKTPFLSGQSGGTWKANFDWAINKNNLVKVVEGNYTQAAKKTKAQIIQDNVVSIKNPFAQDTQ